MEENRKLDQLVDEFIREAEKLRVLAEKPMSEKRKALGLFKVSPCNYEIHVKSELTEEWYEISDSTVTVLKNSGVFEKWVENGVIRHYKG